MKIDFDPAKDKANIEKHGCSLALAEGFEWEGAYVVADSRFDYGEERNVAFGYIGRRLYICVFTDRESVRRLISLRKANDREERVYAKAKA
jgi:uncharacterized DUF497 family protein